MKIVICPSITKKESMNYIEPIANFLTDNGMKVYIDDEFANNHPLPKATKETLIDIIITLGGDGTLLYYRKKYSHLPKVAFTAVNLGGLGFMADVSVDKIDIYLKDLLEKSYDIEERIMLEGKSPNGNIFQAANDFVFHRGSIASMILLKVTINDDHFNTFQADGLIVSTPTGSSAYSLACGGPLMHPTLKAFVLTTISGHTLTNRPFVIPEESIIKIEYITDSKDAIDVTIDGISTFQIKGGEVVELSTSENKFRLIDYTRHNFYQTVREKLNWKGKSTIN